jgi:hypothetical protein
MKKNTARANQNAEKENIRKYIPKLQFILGRMHAPMPFQTDPVPASAPILA